MRKGCSRAAKLQFLRKLRRDTSFLSFLFLATIFGLNLILPFSSSASESSPALFLHTAKTQGLANNRYWHTLLHYKPNFLEQKISLIDDPSFFMAENGKYSPTAELEATLSGLWQLQKEESPQKHVRCRFPARSQWLIDTLNIDPEILPEVTCHELDEALDHIEPRATVLIFPGNHNNSPASMFGHTLLSIEGPYNSRLLAYAVNYAAHTDETNGLLYAVKGIFGLYPGYYSLLPYYVKVREYNDLERRDVWEYELNLTPEETLRMTLHIWELRDIASEYYFFDENCSYNLLFLLETARSHLNLTDRNRPWVIPIDTVRNIEAAGLIEKVKYRPSKATRILTLANQMNRQETALALALINDKLDPNELLTSDVSRVGKIRILDVASETLEFRYYRDEIEQKTYKTKTITIHKPSSKVGQAEERYLEILDPGRPDQGHGSNRFALGIGLWDDDFYQEFRIRPAYHNLLDSDQGFLPGSQIDFANLALRFFPKKNKLELQQLDLINIVSLSPRHAFYHPVSWKVSTGLKRTMFADHNEHLVFQLNLGGGFTWGDNSSMYYGLVETDLLVSGRYRDSFSLGFGATLGLLTVPLPNWKIHLAARKTWHEFGDPHQVVSFSLRQNWKITANTSIALDVSRKYSFGKYVTDTTLLFNFYW